MVLAGKGGQMEAGVAPEMHEAADGSGETNKVVKACRRAVVGYATEEGSGPDMVRIPLAKGVKVWQMDDFSPNKSF